MIVTSEKGHGIVSKDDLKLTSGEYNITAASHALSGKNSIRIASGTYTLTSGKDVCTQKIQTILQKDLCI